MMILDLTYIILYYIYFTLLKKLNYYLLLYKFMTLLIGLNEYHHHMMSKFN